MTSLHLLNKICLQFDDEGLAGDLSAAVFTNDNQYLWVASDEWLSIERLEKIDDTTYGKHRSFALQDLIEGFDTAIGEADIEGIDFDSQYLWIIGSHSSKRKAAKVKKDKVQLDEDDLIEINIDPNRYLLARIPMIEGELKKSHENLTSACLIRNLNSNQLTEVLKEDEYLKDIISINLPGKDNGLDIEGIIISQNKLLIGLRGPVLRGIAILLEVEIREKSPGVLKLKKIGKNGERYKKHFLDLGGLGIRELCLDGSDLLILAGPAMTLDAYYSIFRLKNPFTLPDKSFSTQKNQQLEKLSEIPSNSSFDRAEGMALFSNTESSKAIFIVYDAPSPDRIVNKTAILADVFQLP